MPISQQQANLEEETAPDLTVWASAGDLSQPPLPLDADVLSQLLEIAVPISRSNPGRARQLADLCIEQAEKIDAPAIVPQAAYIQAQSFAIRGEFARALELIELANGRYLSLNKTLPAVRTNLGRIHVLNELGRHQEAIAWGEKILLQVEEYQLSGTDADFLVAMAYNNIGICYRRMGKYEDALAIYETAEASCIANDVQQYLGDIQNNRGVTLVALGRVSEALEAFEAAVFAFDIANLELPRAKSLCNVGEAHLYLGNYAKSVATLREASTLLDPLDALSEEYIIELHQADVYLALNLFPEAVMAYSEASDGFRVASMSHYQARTLWGLGAALTAQSNYQAAEIAFVEATTLFQAADNRPLLCSVMLERAALRTAQGCADEAILLAQEALELVEGNEAWSVPQLYAHLRLADLLLPDSERVEAHLLAAQALIKMVSLPHLRYRLYQRLGHLRLLQGQSEEAIDFLETAVSEIEQLRGNLAQESMRVSFLHDKMMAYEDLLHLHLLDVDDRASIERAFAISEQSRSRALLDLLTGVTESTTPAISDPAQVVELERLQADLNAIYNEFLGGMGNEPHSSPQDRQERAQAIEQQIRHIHLQAEQFPALAENPLDGVLSLSAIEAALDDDLVLLTYHIIGDEIVAFVNNGEGLHVKRPLSNKTTVAQLIQKLNVQWERFSIGGTFSQRHHAQLERSVQRILAALYANLIAPIEPLLTSKRVAIVPHGILHQLPFHALYDGEQYLLERYELSYAPSATVLAICQQRPKRPFTNSLIIGVADDAIPAVHDEVQRTAEILPAATVYMDDEAKTAVFQQEAADHSLIHLACHGIYRSDNPLFSALRLGDGWLTAADVLQMNLTDALVTLSACESGRGGVTAGDELIGLTRAFLGAGATSLLVSLWLIHDNTTAELMVEWYKHLLKNPHHRAAALRQAQLSLKERHPHPYYWASFALVGKR